MNRLFRVGLIVAGIVSGYYVVKLIREYLAERRNREAFPADRADDLLNPGHLPARSKNAPSL